MSQRSSNMELLRIVSMGMVLAVHANFYTFKAPQVNGAFEWMGFARVYAQSLLLICVNLFILISGYFGMQWKVRSVGRLAFQCFFYGIGICALFALFRPVTADEWAKGCRALSYNNWFISAYLGLLLLSPLLNAYVEHVSRRTFALFLGLFFLFETYWGFITRQRPDFGEGYSILSFLLLYGVGRYLARYGVPHWLTAPRRCGKGKAASLLAYRTAPRGFFRLRPTTFYLSGYLLVGVLNTLLFYLQLPDIRWAAYDNPLVLVETVLFFLIFRELHFTSRAVNWVARSSFAVFLIHCHPLVRGWYVQGVQGLYGATVGAPGAAFSTTGGVSSVLLFLAMLVLSMVVIFIGCVLIDQVRIWVWGKMEELLRPSATSSINRGGPW